MTKQMLLAVSYETFHLHLAQTEAHLEKQSEEAMAIHGVMQHGMRPLRSPHPC